MIHFKNNIIETPRGSQANEIEEVQKAQGIEAQDDVTHEGNPTQNTSRRGSKTSGIYVTPPFHVHSNFCWYLVRNIKSNQKNESDK